MLLFSVNLKTMKKLLLIIGSILCFAASYACTYWYYAIEGQLLKEIFVLFTVIVLITLGVWLIAIFAAKLTFDLTDKND